MFLNESVLKSLEAAGEPAAPAFHKPTWWDDAPPIGDGKRGRNHRSIIRAYIEGRLKKSVLSTPSNGRHIFTTRKRGTELWIFKDNPSIKVSVCIAKKIGGIFIGNSSGLQVAKSKGRINWTGGTQLKVQEWLSQVMPMVPFRTFQEAKLDLDSMEIVEKAPEETLQIKRFRYRQGMEHELYLEPRHFTGALLFKIGKPDVRHYLFDVDRNDAALGRFNPFLSRLPRACSSIADAYDSLKPDEIRQAERFLKIPCPRQGEWFFIPSAGEHVRSNKPSQNLRGFGGPSVQAVLQSNGNRPHYVTELSEDGFVRGKVLHGGWEHEPITLPGWHKPVGNGAVESFKISGAID
jgi:hypothetical protein